MRESTFGSLLLVCFAIPLSSASVVLKPFFFVFNDIPAKFAVGVNSSGSCGALHLADPLDACSQLHNGFSHNRTSRFALIVRGRCSFEDKVRNAQNGGFQAAIIFDDREKGNLVYMMVNPEGISIHAVFVSRTSGEILKEHALGEAECCIYPSHQETAWTVFAISLISLLVVLAILAPFLAPRHWFYGWGTNRQSQSLDIKMVEALPSFSFSSSRLSDCHTGETCAICLEDYRDGETLKVLPCQHEFHSGCVDSWLTKWGTSCPVCKHDLRTKIAYAEIKRAGWH